MSKTSPYRIRRVRPTGEAEKPVAPVSPGAFELGRGRAWPLGATPLREGVNFAVLTTHASAVTLVVFVPGGDRPTAEFRLDSRDHRTGDVWHAMIRGLGPGIEYGYRVDDEDRLLLDPYARIISGAETWGAGVGEREPGRSEFRARRAVVAEAEDDFDWGGDRPPGTGLADSVIYELHVRGYTRHASSGVAHPGTFRGVVEKIPHLQALGVTAVELLPVTEFEELDNRYVNPETGEPLVNFWGYHPIGFFAPKASYGAVREFKEMVRGLHAAGIEVILDVVFNHTGEGDADGPTFGFRGLDDAIYYMVDPDTGEYRNYSGTGNTLNCNHPVVADMLVDALRYWVTEMHIDGFRFDLAAALTRDADGDVMANPPLIERISSDPVLAGTKLIAEAWDATDLYLVGTFPGWGHWSEWNDKFRDDVRRFVRGEAGMVPLLATRLAGSSDLYGQNARGPFHSVNYVTSHDGLTLWDVVSYDRRHNEANGEDNEDGHSETLSWNCGVEGPAHSGEINALRRRQVRNFATLLLMSQGVPMILAGDEFGRTQRGNNNAYCQDNDISWVDWNLLEANADLFRFFKLLIRFRRQHPSLRRRAFFAERSGPGREVAWHGTRLERPDWSLQSRSLAMHIPGRSNQPDIHLIANSFWERQRFELPDCPGAKRWFRFVDTSLDPPQDICEPADQPCLRDQRSYDAGPRSVVVLVGR